MNEHLLVDFKNTNTHPLSSVLKIGRNGYKCYKAGGIRNYLQGKDSNRMPIAPIHIGDNISNSFNENKGNQNFRSEFSDSPITQSLITTPDNIKASATKIRLWYTKPLFIFFIWPVIGLIAAALILHFVFNIG
jgi:hypothetical protein